ncbi:hypothetical protein GPALN_005255 [Globodera pallida]|nr:hypothetical protein GPALN_005255 [Globodera pallida]
MRHNNSTTKGSSADSSTVLKSITVISQSSDPSTTDDVVSISDKSRKSSTTISSLGERPNGLSYAQILITFLKGMIGPGCLSLPLAFRQAGLWTGLILVIILGFLNLRCMHKLVECSQRLSKKKGNSFLSYGSLAYETFSNSFAPFKRYNRIARIVVNASIIALQMGICSVFYVFCADHVREFFAFKYPTFNYSKPIWMLLIFVPMVLVNFVRSLRAISVLSSIGNIICIVALTFIFQYLVRAEHQNLSEFSTITNFDGIMAACGAILYSFEGQAMVLPLENRLQKPSQMVGLFGILSVGIAVVSAIYSTSGFLGYITYGAQVKGSITQNLPQNEIQFVVVRLLFTLVMYFGFVIQMYVIVEMLWPEFVKLLQKFCPKLGDDENEGVKTKKLCVELLFRTSAGCHCNANWPRCARFGEYYSAGRCHDGNAFGTDFPRFA